MVSLALCSSPTRSLRLPSDNLPVLTHTHAHTASHVLFVTTMAVYAEQKPVADCHSIEVYDQNDYWAGINIAFDTNTATIYLKGLDLNKVEPDFHSYFGKYKVLDFRNKQGFSVIQLNKPDYVNAYTPGYFGFHLIDRNDFDSAGLGTFTATCNPLRQPTPPRRPIRQVGPAMPKDSKKPTPRGKSNTLYLSHTISPSPLC